jgi:hypothetical protein
MEPFTVEFNDRRCLNNLSKVLWQITPARVDRLSSFSYRTIPVASMILVLRCTTTRNLHIHILTNSLEPLQDEIDCLLILVS